MEGVSLFDGYDYLSKAIGEKHPAVKMLTDCKKFIRIDELTRAMKRGGLVEVGKKWKEIFDENVFLLQASQWALKYDVNSLVEYLEGSAIGVLGALTKSIEMGIKSGIILGTSVLQIKKKNAMQEFVEKYNAPIAIAFYYSPVSKEFQYSMFTVESKESKVDELRNGAYDFSCLANEKIGLNKWKGLHELYSPKHNAGILRGGVTFDREMVWRILLRFLT